MIMGTDGACKWGGTPECVSCGVAVIHTDERTYYMSKIEDHSTSQRGELNGLLLGLHEAVEHNDNEDVIIITDSEYLHNAVMKEWCYKWKANDWIGSNGERVKNVDKWMEIVELIDKLRAQQRDVFLQWTKGHLISGLSPAIVKRIMQQDVTGLGLISQIQTIADRVSEHDRIVEDFNKHRMKNDAHIMPAETAIEWTVLNVAADLIAGFIKDTAIAAGI